MRFYLYDEITHIHTLLNVVFPSWLMHCNYWPDFISWLLYDYWSTDLCACNILPTHIYCVVLYPYKISTSIELVPLTDWSYSLALDSGVDIIDFPSNEGLLKSMTDAYPSTWFFFWSIFLLNSMKLILYIVMVLCQAR